jgi:asparagine synthase (glutamine-hydrolysing)
VCGIAGYTKIEHPIEPGRISRVVESIRHRGPDEQGWHESEVAALGNARLSIIDVSHGRQPMFTNGGDLALVFNGEIYNHGEIRNELESLGRRFETNCDTEVVLQAFSEWDTRSFSKLRGMFAAAFWQESRRRLVLLRDRMGIKPLYMYHRGRDIYFGSELKTIFAHPEIPRILDRQGLNYFLSLNYVPAPYTLVEGLEKVLPGEYAEWIDGSFSRTQYWQLRFDVDPKWTEAAARERLDELMRLSVREHLISDVPLGVWASGGLDSSAVLHYAAQEVPRGLKTFSISFAGHAHDESEYFRQVAAKYGTDHHEFDLNPEAALTGTIEQMVEYSDEPSADAGALPVWFLSQMTRQHVKVALSGEGADELFGGYLTYLADDYYLRAQRWPRWMRSAALACARLLPVSDEKIGFEYKAKRFLEGTLLDGPDAHLFWNGACSGAQKRALIGKNRYDSPGRLMTTLPTEAYRSGEINRYLWLDQKYYLTDDILYKCDRMSMAHSLEVRPPFLDHRIVEFAATLPQHFKVSGKTLKAILRDLMRDKLPEAVLTRKKEGFDIPAHRWFRGALRPMIEDVITERAARESGVFSWDALRALQADHQRRRANNGYILWGLLILFLWMRRWKIQSA